MITVDRFNSFDIESFKVDIINDLVTADVIDDQKLIVKNIEIKILVSWQNVDVEFKEYFIIIAVTMNIGFNLK